MNSREISQANLLIIDDDEQIRKLLTEILREQYDCTAATSAEESLTILESVEFSLVISDINMAGISGLDLVPRILHMSPDTVVVMISGQQAIQSAIEAMRVGAYDYVTKPLDIRHVKAAVDRAVSYHHLLKQKRQYEEHLEGLVERRTAEVQRLAYYDLLTDLPNRALLTERLGETLRVANRKSEMAGVLLISLDRFKKINDTLGHTTGDLLLREVAKRLSNCAGNPQFLARTGGDEFALVRTGFQQPELLGDQAR